MAFLEIKLGGNPLQEGALRGPTTTPLGQHGEISVTGKGTQWVARCRVRGLDGVTRKIERSGKSRTAARFALRDELRSQRGELRLG